MSDDWVPLTDAHVVDALDSAEVIEGYHDGRKNEPRPGPNRSPAYRHGWRVGQADGGHRQPDAWDMELIANMREAKPGVFKPGLLDPRRRAAAPPDLTGAVVELRATLDGLLSWYGCDTDGHHRERARAILARVKVTEDGDAV